MAETTGTGLLIEKAGKFYPVSAEELADAVCRALNGRPLRELGFVAAGCRKTAGRLLDALASSPPTVMHQI